MQLSDRPALHSTVDRLERATPASEKPLAWTDLDISGSAYCDDDIWEDINYGVESSEDDVSSVFSIPPSPRIRPESSVVPDEDYVIPDEVFSTGEDEDLITSINSAQFWKPENNAKRDRPSSRVITELQMLRETIFMLQGLPTSLFWNLDGEIELDRRYTLPHSSDEALSSVLRSFCSIGAKIGVSRQFTSVPQSVPYMQTFHRRIEGYLHNFDRFLSDTQSQCLSPKSTMSISLLRLLDDVRRESRLLLALSDLISSLDRDQSGARCLDMLYDLVCMTQATDDKEFRLLSELFLSCFETYARPIRLWVEKGQLDSRQGSFFVGENRKDAALRTLWHDWYMLGDSAHTPKFLQSIAHKVFTTGKNMVFLRHLSVLPETINLEKMSISFEDIFPGNSPSICLPFSALFEARFENLVDANHSVTSNLLRNELDQQCGLWVSLQALEHIYLCRDMSILSSIDNKVFDLIDRGGAWNDRFLLTELAQSAFSLAAFIDPPGLIVRSRKPKLSRSVKTLEALSFDYVLPWPVANIITKESIATYQRISTFLMQIRRAKHAILRQHLQDHQTSKKETKTPVLSYALRHNMLWFLNTLYSHMTDLVISTTTTSMRKSLSSKDVNSMISIHHDYMTSLESQCLLSDTLSPIHEAIIDLLDTCIEFSDLHTATDSTRSPYPRKEIEYTTTEDNDTDDEPEPEPAPKLPSPNAPNSETYTHQLNSFKNTFSTLVTSITTSLKEIGRVDGQTSWMILAEKLEWRNKVSSSGG